MRTPCSLVASSSPWSGIELAGLSPGATPKARLGHSCWGLRRWCFHGFKALNGGALRNLNGDIGVLHFSLSSCLKSVLKKSGCKGQVQLRGCCCWPYAAGWNPARLPGQVQLPAAAASGLTLQVELWPGCQTRANSGLLLLLLALCCRLNSGQATRLEPALGCCCCCCQGQGQLLSRHSCWPHCRWYCERRAAKAADAASALELHQSFLLREGAAQWLRVGLWRRANRLRAMAERQVR